MAVVEHAVKIKNLSVTLGGHFEALKGIDLDLPAGKVVAFIGPSGAGKTTLIRTIVGRLQITSGSVSVLGRPAGSATLRSQVSYMTQGLSVYPDLTVRQNLAYFATMIGLKKAFGRAAVDDTLAAVDLADKADNLVSNLSGGQKQRVSLGIALLGSPKLLVLDEPTVGLDPLLRDQLWNLFNNLSSQGVTLIVSSHSMDEAERCDDLVLIRDGEIIAHETPAKLRESTSSKTVEESFLKLAGEQG